MVLSKTERLTLPSGKTGTVLVEIEVVGTITIPDFNFLSETMYRLYDELMGEVFKKIEYGK